VAPIFRRRTDEDVVETAVVDEPAATEEVIEEEVPAGPPPPRIWPWLLALLLLVLAGGVAWWLLTREEEKTTMPNVIGLRETQARARLAEAELEADVDRRQSRRATGIVFAQTPGAGTQLDEGERVEILVSSGRIRVVVPEVVGEREEPAVNTLRTAGFRVDVQRVFAGASQGEVVEQDPVGGSRAPQGSEVLVKVSKGRNLSPVPDVLGLTETEAVRRLRAREFEPRIFDVPSPDPRGIVVAQEPRGGVQAPPDARVRINVSTGEETGEPRERTTPTTPAAGRVEVPDVVGLAQTPALRRLDAVNLRGVVAYRTSNEPRGRVIEQRPTAGSGAARDSQVRVVVSSGPTSEPVEVPDVRGQDLETARQTLEDLGLRVEVIRTGDGDRVEEQQPSAGVTAYRGAVVTLFVGSG
jgi:beta-lactam-binding protein with PASTA domain